MLRSSPTNNKGQLISTPPTKAELRKALRQARREHVQAQPDSIRALLFHRPPRPVVENVASDAVIGLYHSAPFEAPAYGYAKFFLDQGNTIALPWFASETSAMQFRLHSDPYDGEDLEVGPFGMLQPDASAELLVPDVLFIPLLGFTEAGERLGQGGGHYDRWLAEHPGATKIGLAWDVQLCASLPNEPHDIALDAIVTPTRIYGAL